MGTPHYMSPEQATGDLSVGAATDIYALGCVLYEMLVGEPPYTGSTAQAILGKIIAGKLASASEERASVPANVDAAIRKALEKIPADRFTDAQQFAFAIGDSTFRYGDVAAAPFPAAQGYWRRTSLVLLLLLVVATSVAAWSLRTGPEVAPSPTFRAEIPESVVRLGGVGRRMAISRDGATLVVAGRRVTPTSTSFRRMLWVRRSDDLEFRPIPGTETASGPSMSPDGEWVVFESDGGLNKVQVGGGPVLPVVGEGSFPHWYAEDEIIFQGRDGGAYSVNSAGGAPSLIATGNTIGPFMLPGGAAILGEGPQAGPDGVYLTELASGESRLIARGGTDGHYLPTGHIIYADRVIQSVLAVPFDLEGLEVTGRPVPVLQSVSVGEIAALNLAVSHNGTLAYGISAIGAGGTERFSWVHMDGSVEDLSLEIPQGQVSAPRISPDGTRFAYQVTDLSAIFVFNFSTGERTQVTQDLSAELPVWSADGSQLYFSTSNGEWYRTTPDGSMNAEKISAEPMGGPMVTMSPDGAWIVADDRTSAGQPDIFTVRLGAEPLAPRSYLRADWHEEKGVVSPDGRWLAYTSDESDGHQVYLRSFPEPGPKVRVSSDRGDAPVWAPDGSALYYLGGGDLVRRDVRLADTVELGEERPVFSKPRGRSDFVTRIYDIHPDGDRFLFLTSGGGAVQSGGGGGSIMIVTNWFTELRERMGGN